MQIQLYSGPSHRGSGESSEPRSAAPTLWGHADVRRGKGGEYGSPGWDGESVEVATVQLGNAISLYGIEKALLFEQADSKAGDEPTEAVADKGDLGDMSRSA